MSRKTDRYDKLRGEVVAIVTNGGEVELGSEGVCMWTIVGGVEIAVTVPTFATARELHRFCARNRGDYEIATGPTSVTVTATFYDDDPVRRGVVWGAVGMACVWVAAEIIGAYSGVLFGK
jgi:hypothetical protein